MRGCLVVLYVHIDRGKHGQPTSNLDLRLEFDNIKNVLKQVKNRGLFVCLFSHISQHHSDIIDRDLEGGTPSVNCIDA